LYLSDFILCGGSMRKHLFVSVLAIILFVSACKKSSTPTTPNTPTAPSINSFTVTPASIYQGETATLSWSVTNADTVEIDQGIGSVALSGNRAVNPNVDTTYILSARNTAGTKTASVLLTVKYNLKTTNSSGSYTIKISLTQTGGNVTGTFDSALGILGNITGTVSGSTFSATMTGTNLDYHGTASGTISNLGRRIDGSGTDNGGSFTFWVTKK
jgi:hypothetical protein